MYLKKTGNSSCTYSGEILGRILEPFLGGSQWEFSDKIPQGILKTGIRRFNTDQTYLGTLGGISHLDVALENNLVESLEPFLKKILDVFMH